MRVLLYTLFAAAMGWLVWKIRRVIQRHDRRQRRTQLERPPQGKTIELSNNRFGLPKSLKLSLHTLDALNSLDALRTANQSAPNRQQHIYSTTGQIQHQLAVELAVDSTTAPDRLVELSHDQRTTVRVAVASNPNTPPDTLIQLAKQFPLQVAANPMFELMQLENPQFISEMRVDDLTTILDHPNTPPIWINSAIRHGDRGVINKLLDHPHLSESSLEYLITRMGNTEFARKLMHHPNCTDRLKQAIAQQLKANIKAQKNAILKNSKFYSSNDI
jgi:hypothetical protein